MKCFAISGLGADKRVFSFLDLEINIIAIDWIKPKNKEAIKNYAKRLIDKYEIKKEDYILGVSFGGLIAVEISKQLNSVRIILVSSVEVKSDLRKIYRLFGKSKIIKLIPKGLLNPPKPIAKWIFGAKNSKLLFDILNDTDLDFAKWAINELICWKNTEKIQNIIKINGDKDKLIPLKQDKNTIIIKNGAHFMIVDKASEISNVINNCIESL